MTEHNENPVAEETEVVRDLNVVIAELKREGGKLSRQEAKAVESDKSAEAFNAEIMQMASGEKEQTATRNIASIAGEQAKHIKRAAKFRTNNEETVTNVLALRDELNGFIDELTAPYATEASEDSADVEEEQPETEEA